MKVGFFMTLLPLLSFVNFQDTIAQAPKDPDPLLSFYGSGAIQKSLDNGDKLPASTGLGVNWTYWTPDAKKDKYFFNKLELDVSVNVASSVDTLIAKYDLNNLITNSSSFGSSILTPLNSGQAAKFLLRLNFKKGLFFNNTFIDGIKIKYIGSNRNWKADDNGQPKFVLGTNNYFRIGLFQEFLTGDLLDNYSLNFGLYFAYNSIQGDIGQTSNDQFRTKILGSMNKNFYGPEAAFEIRLKNLRAEFGYSWLRAGTKDEVLGLTSGRLVTTISFVGGFGIKLKD